jgi:hypothetical protein
MLVFSYKCGQLGNRLFAYAHMIAVAEANGLRVVNLSFDEYARYFNGTSEDIFCRYPQVRSSVQSGRIRSWLFVANKAILKLLRVLKLENGPGYSVIVADLPEYQFKETRYYDMKTPAFLQQARKNAVLLFGRFFRDYENMQLHQEVIRNYFTPVAQINSRIEDFINNARKGCDRLVGVHMRRGDYAQFAKGKYFYSFSDYKIKIEELQGAAGSIRLKFVLCSNEDIDASNFGNLDVVKGPGRAVEDMYALSKCDYIMGPPSTFTLWASFYGKKPLYQIRNINDPIDLNSFKYFPPEILFNFCFN